MKTIRAQWILAIVISKNYSTSVYSVVLILKRKLWSFNCELWYILMFLAMLKDIYLIYPDIVLSGSKAISCLLKKLTAGLDGYSP